MSAIVSDLPADLSTRPAYVLQSKGYVRIYWTTPDATPDADGFTLHATLTFEHAITAGRKVYRATESLAMAEFSTGHREIITFHSARRRVLSETPAPRYNARAFAAFVHSILGGNLPA